MQFTGGKKPPVGIVYDSDFGAGIDTVLALALLHGLENKSEARLSAITLSNSEMQAAQLADVIEKFFAGAPSNQPMASFQALAIGLMERHGAAEGRSLYRAFFEKKDAENRAVYVPRVRQLNDTAVPELLIRNALSAQYDGNAAIVCCGAPVNLLRLLGMPGAPDLVTAKVRMLVTTGQVSDKLADAWPTPITVIPEELGKALPFPAAAIEKDFGYAPAHPVADAYRAFRPMPYDAPGLAMAAALFAVRGEKEPYFKLSESKRKNVRVAALNPDQKERILAAYAELASAKPQPRVRRPAAVVAVEENKVAQ